MVCTRTSVPPVCWFTYLLLLLPGLRLQDVLLPDGVELAALLGKVPEAFLLIVPVHLRGGAVNGLPFYSAFLTSGHSTRFTILPLHSPIHAHIDTPTAASATRSDSQLVRSGQGEVSRSGTPRPGNLLVPSQPALPPEPHAAEGIRRTANVPNPLGVRSEMRAALPLLLGAG